MNHEGHEVEKQMKTELEKDKISFEVDGVSRIFYKGGEDDEQENLDSVDYSDRVAPARNRAGAGESRRGRAAHWRGEKGKNRSVKSHRIIWSMCVSQPT